jgi:hypothetical protein
VTHPGLCGTCTHARVIQTKRSHFHLCERSFTDTRFTKYPRLPMLACPGYESVDDRKTSASDDAPPRDRE